MYVNPKALFYHNNKNYNFSLYASLIIQTILSE